MKRSNSIRITAVIARPLAAAGIFLGAWAVGPVAMAFAAPTPDTQCSSMAMPDTQAGGANPNPLTRAGQIGAVGNSAASDAGMPMDCNAVSHG